MKKHILFLSLFSLACLVWQCKDEPKEEPTPTRPNCKMNNVFGIDSIAYDAQGRLASVHKYRLIGGVKDYRGSYGKATRNAQGDLIRVDFYTDLTSTSINSYHLFEYDAQRRITKGDEYIIQAGQFVLWRTTTFAYSAGKVTVTRGSIVADFNIDAQGNVSSLTYPSTPSANIIYEYGDAPNDLPKEFAYFDRFPSFISSWGAVVMSNKMYIKYTKGTTERVERVHTLNDKGYVISTNSKTFLNNTLNSESTSTYNYKCD
jgi:hypothetical protein